MKLNDYLVASFEGWTECSPHDENTRGFLNEKAQISVTISLEANNKLPNHLHLSIGRNGSIELPQVSDGEAYAIINVFFPGAVMSKSENEFTNGSWGEFKSIILKNVRHFLKLI